jgi:hypothetical protein
MSTYTPNTWTTGQVITAAKLNNLETQYDAVRSVAAGVSATGVVTASDQSFSGIKTFVDGAVIGGTNTVTINRTTGGTNNGHFKFVYSDSSPRLAWMVSAAEKISVATDTNGAWISKATGSAAYNFRDGADQNLMTIDSSAIVTLYGQANLKSYTVGTVPSASAAGAIIYVSNAGGNGPCIAVANGSVWKRCDNTSTTVS